MNKTIPLTLPEQVWGKLASAAATEKRSIGDIIAEGIDYALLSVPERQELPKLPPREVPRGERWRHMVRDAHLSGWTDQEMSLAFAREWPSDHWTKTRVSDLRRSLGLSANKRPM